jgi:hypothetical protein
MSDRLQQPLWRLETETKAAGGTLGATHALETEGNLGRSESVYPSPQHNPLTQHDDSWPSYGPVPWDPGYPQPVYRPSTAPAYAAAAIFGACSLLSFVLAVASWSGTGNLHFTAAVIGVVFSESLTGNIDFGISATMTVACSTLTFAALLTTRLGFIRWILVSIGAIVSVYYVVALVYLVSHDAGRYVSVALLSLFLWASATTIGALPSTARAMRR